MHLSLYIRNDFQGRRGESAFMLQMEKLREDCVNKTRANSRFITAYQWNIHMTSSIEDGLFP